MSSTHKDDGLMSEEHDEEVRQEEDAQEPGKPEDPERKKRLKNVAFWAKTGGEVQEVPQRPHRAVNDRS